MKVTLTRFWIRLTADKKRFSILCCLLAFGLLFWARLLVVSRVPKTAVASDVIEAPEELPDVRIEAPMPPIVITVSERPMRDPFLTSEAVFPSRIDGLNPGNGGKSRDQAAEKRDLEAVRRARVKALADEMRLGIVSMGSSGLAVLNDQTYRLGDTVPGPGGEVEFILVELRQRTVMLEHEGHRYEVKMSQPGS